ncbi:Zinc finger, GRF-type [Sesbania bispinosa]|nr:Zinc finger, GRF-type [Sesbania bispinosa]
MASQSYSSPSRGNGHALQSYCLCGLVATDRTSWTDKNRGRRFLQCPIKMNNRMSGCNYFDWVDAPEERMFDSTDFNSMNPRSGHVKDYETELSNHLKCEIGMLQVTIAESKKREEMYLKLFLCVSIALMSVLFIFSFK